MRPVNIKKKFPEIYDIFNATNKKSVVFINEILNFNIDIFDISKKYDKIKRYFS